MLKASGAAALALGIAAPICAQVQTQPQVQARLAQPQPQPQPWLWSRLTEDLTRLAQEVDGRVGLYLRGLDSGETFSLRGDEVFPAASTIKLALLLELYRQADSGKGPARLTDEYVLRPQDRVEGSSILGHLTPGTRLNHRDLALFMVAVSDNSAANILIDRLGMDRVNATLQSLGLKQTRLQRKMMDVAAAQAGRENLSSPRELAELLTIFQSGTLLQPASRADALRLLATPKEGFLTRLLPEDLVVANKPGTLAGVRNDAGIVFLKGRSFVIAVMSSHLRDERQAEAAIARLAHRAAAYFDVVGATSPEGRVLGELQVR